MTDRLVFKRTMKLFLVVILIVAVLAGNTAISLLGMAEEHEPDTDVTETVPEELSEEAEDEESMPEEGASEEDFQPEDPSKGENEASDGTESSSGEGSSEEETTQEESENSEDGTSEMPSGEEGEESGNGEGPWTGGSQTGDAGNSGWEDGESSENADDDAEEEPDPLDTLEDPLLSPAGIGGPAVRSLTNPDDLGDWLHYNGLIFDGMVAYQADAEGAIAVGGDAHFGVIGGYDIGASYNYSKYSHLGEYTNAGNRFPTLLLGGQSVRVGPEGQTEGGSGIHYNVFGGPIVLTQTVYEELEESEFNLSLYPEVNSGGFPTSTYHDWVIGEQQTLNRWFAEQRAVVNHCSQMFLDAGEAVIDMEYFSKFKNQGMNTFQYIEDADAQAVNPYLNKRLVDSSGQVDDTVLIITVESDADLVITDSANGYGLPISAEWAQEYELIVFNFPNAVTVTMDADPQTVSKGLGENKTWQDGYVSPAAAAERHAICERVVYNFPSATSIDMDNTYLMGSLMAPNAMVSGDGGSVNGMLICDSFETKGGMELHALRLTDHVKKVYPPKEGYVAVQKYVYDNGTTETALDGAVFVLLDQHGQYYAGSGKFVQEAEDAATYSPAGGQPAIISGLPLGTYTLREIEAPPGYVLNTGNSQNTSTYHEWKVVVSDKEEIVTVKRYNQALSMDVHLKKVAQADHSTLLEGAIFRLLRKNGERYEPVVDSAATGSDGKVIFAGLTPGVYVVQEISPPEGYQGLGDRELTFTISQSGDTLMVTSSDLTLGSGSGGDPYLVENKPKGPDNCIRVYKYRYDTQKPEDTGTGLGDAAFDLYRESPETPGNWILVTQNDDPEGAAAMAIVTNPAGSYEIGALRKGRYRLVETRAPNGYDKNNQHTDDTVAGTFPGGYALEFTVDSDDGEQTVQVANHRRTVPLTLEKYTVRNGAEQALPEATFRLWRMEAVWSAYSTNLTTGNDGKLTLPALEEGEYKLDEVSAPEGFELLDPTNIYLNVSFPNEGEAKITVTYDGKEADKDTSPVSAHLEYGAGETAIRLRVENKASSSGLIICKQDDEGHPIPHVPFLLWKVTSGAERWDGTMSQEEILAALPGLEYTKVTGSGGDTFLTGPDGTVALENMEPGVYVLFESWNNQYPAYLRDILYLLSHMGTPAAPSPALYSHLTIFQVVQDGKDLRIQWVDRNKAWSGEAVVGDDAGYPLTVVNKRLQKVSLTFTKVDAGNPPAPLEGAGFTLYEKRDFTLPNGDMDAYEQVDTALSSLTGEVSFKNIGASWKYPDGSEVTEGYRVSEDALFCAEYMVVETEAPEGYRSGGEPIYFRLELNPTSKMLDFHLLDAQGNTLSTQPGYTAPTDGSSSGTFHTTFTNPDYPNERACTFRFRKVSGLAGNPLKKAEFALYQCNEEGSHLHDEMAGENSCWKPYLTAVSSDDGLVTFPQLPTGQYQLVETSPPEGYELPTGQWRITVDAEAQTVDIGAVGDPLPPAFAVASDRDSEAAFWLLNRKEPSMPLTGEEGPLLYLLLGAAFVYATVSFAIYRTSKRTS